MKNDTVLLTDTTKAHFTTQRTSASADITVEKQMCVRKLLSVASGVHTVLPATVWTELLMSVMTVIKDFSLYYCSQIYLQCWFCWQEISRNLKQFPYRNKYDQKLPASTMDLFMQGTSFEFLTLWNVNLIVNHINSTPKKPWRQNLIWCCPWIN